MVVADAAFAGKTASVEESQIAAANYKFHATAGLYLRIDVVDMVGLLVVLSPVHLLPLRTAQAVVEALTEEELRSIFLTVELATVNCVLVVEPREPSCTWLAVVNYSLVPPGWALPVQPHACSRLVYMS